MIIINDMFRAISTRQSCWNRVVWHLEEWTPTGTPAGRWQRVSKRLDADSFDRLLERKQCPVSARDAFRAEITKGTEKILLSCG